MDDINDMDIKIELKENQIIYIATNVYCSIYM